MCVSPKLVKEGSERDSTGLVDVGHWANGRHSYLLPLSFSLFCSHLTSFLYSSVSPSSSWPFFFFLSCPLFLVRFFHSSLYPSPPSNFQIVSPVGQSVCLPGHLSISLFIHLSIHLSYCPSIFLSLVSSISLSVCPSVSVRPFILWSVYLSLH